MCYKRTGQAGPGGEMDNKTKLSEIKRLRAALDAGKLSLHFDPAARLPKE